MKIIPQGSQLSFWAPALKSPAENSIPNKSMDTLLFTSSEGLASNDL